MGTIQIKEASVETGTAAPTRILVVDDSKLQRRILRASIRKFGYEVEEAEDGVQALEMVRSGGFDVVLSDWMMPGLSGPSLCRALRDMDGAEYVYFILQTSRAEKNDVAEGLDSGADDFLAKPVNSGELLARIRAGERLLTTQRDLARSNAAAQVAYERIKTLYDALDRDLEEAKKLQHSLIPNLHWQNDTAEAALLLRSSGHVGGDLVGFVHLPGDKLGLFAIDVSGHGVSSALLTARLAGYFNASNPDASIVLERLPGGIMQAKPPDQVAADLNQRLHTEVETEHYFTLVYAIADPVSGTVRAVQAGHPHPILFDRQGKARLLGTGGPPIGLIDGVDYEAFSFVMAKGDRLLIQSDGMTECMSRDGSMLDEDGLAQLARPLLQIPAKGFLERLEDSLIAYNGGTDMDDDVSAIVFDYQGSPK